MKITFRDLKSCVEGDDDTIIQYLNQFKGENIFEKFKNILIQWEKNVSYTLGFKVGDKNINLSLLYIVEELSKFSHGKIELVCGDMVFIMDVPKKFSNSVDILAISDFIYELKYLNTTINFSDLTDLEKNQILESLPAKIYNELVIHLSKIKNKSVLLENKALGNMEINFFTATPYNILQDLIRTYSIDYFRDVIYVLSKKIDGQILLDSTMMDIEYYIDKIKSDNVENLT